jgi:Bacteriocin-protection, YdeI or OmpD-Associated
MSEALSEKEISGGVVHDLPADLKRALTSDAKALETWEDITPLARNEWICWIESAKGVETRARRSNGAVPASKTESGDPVVGLGVRIVTVVMLP